MSRQVFLITRQIRLSRPGAGRDVGCRPEQKKREKSFKKPGRGRRAFKDTDY